MLYPDSDWFVIVGYWLVHFADNFVSVVALFWVYPVSSSHRFYVEEENTMIQNQFLLVFTSGPSLLDATLQGGRLLWRKRPCGSARRLVAGAAREDFAE